MDLLIGNDQINMIGSLVGKTQGGLHHDLRQLSGEMSDALNQLDANLRDLLDSGMNRLDTEAQTVTTGLLNGLGDFEAKLKPDIEQVEQALSTAIQEVHNHAGEVVGQIEDSVVDIGARIQPPADHIFDRAAWNTISVGAGLLLLLGLFVAGAAVIQAKGWPEGIGGLIAAVLLLAFVCLAGALTFFPPAKELVLKFVRKVTVVPTIPPTPEIFSVDPDPVIIVRTREIRIHGVHLTPGGIRPAIAIDGRNADIRGAGHSQIVVAIPMPDDEPRELAQPHTVQLTLTYPDGTAVGYPLRLARTSTSPELQPAEIVISGITFDPPSPVATQNIVHPTVTLENRGGTPSKPFQLIWMPTPGRARITATIPPIAADSQPHAFTFPNGYTFRSGGTFETEISSNSSEMGCNQPYKRSYIVVESVPQASYPVLRRAVAVFRSWDDGKEADTKLVVTLLDQSSQDNPYNPLDPSQYQNYVHWFIEHAVARGEDDGLKFANGLTQEFDLDIPQLTPGTSPKFPGFVSVTIVPPSNDTWRFDYSLRLTFSDDPEPRTIDFGSAELDNNHTHLERRLPIISG